MSDQPRLTVREMRLDEVDLRIDYFHDASDEYLRTLGVDRALLPAREAGEPSTRRTTAVRYRNA